MNTKSLFKAIATAGLLLLPATVAAVPALSTPAEAPNLGMGLRMKPNGEGGCTGEALLTTPTVSASQVRSVGVSARLENCVWRFTSLFFERVDGSRCEVTFDPEGAPLGDCGVDMPRQYPTGDHSDSRSTKQVAYTPRKHQSTPGSGGGGPPPPPECQSQIAYGWAKTYSWTGAGSSWERIYNHIQFHWDTTCGSTMNGGSVSGDCSQHYGFHITSCGPHTWNVKKGPTIRGSSKMESNWNDFWHKHTTWANTEAGHAGASYTYGGSCPISGGLPDGAEHNCVTESGA